jgi:UDP-glucose 4-epimerase
MDLTKKKSRLKDVKRIVVLGETGFIGSHILAFFESVYGEVESIGISSQRVNLLDSAAVAELGRYFEPETAVVFCSAIVKRGNTGNDLNAYLQNITMVANICKLLEEHPVGWIGYLSTTAVYGEDTNHGRISEETLPSPNSYYGLAKYNAEWLLQKACDSLQGTKLAVLRLPYVYGHGQKEIIGDYGPGMFLQKAMRGQEITIWGDGAELREFAFIDDVVAVCEQLLIADFAGVINVVSGNSRSFKDILDIVGKLAQSGIVAKSKPRTKNPVDHLFLNNKITQILPEFSSTSLEEGVDKTWSIDSAAMGMV